MIAAAGLGLLFAALSVAAGRWVDDLAGGGPDWDSLQGGLLLARFIAIFAAAFVVWKLTGRSDLVAVFVVTGAVGQMVGQIWFWMRDERKRKGKGNA